MPPLSLVQTTQEFSGLKQAFSVVHKSMEYLDTSGLTDISVAGTVSGMQDTKRMSGSRDLFRPRVRTPTMMLPA